jgi:putative spermidine/putrescine transport system permease protein
MQRIDGDLMRAAAALGATPLFAFWRVFFPLSLPGLTAGGLLVFVLSIGYYVTPQLLGGGTTVMAGQLIQRNVELFSSWGAASAVSVVLLGILGDEPPCSPRSRFWGMIGWKQTTAVPALHHCYLPYSA